MINVGDYVTRRSYNHDIVFLVIDKIDKNCILQGVDVRLIADADESDLVLSDKRESNEEDLYKCIKEIELDRSEYFYLPGKVLHLDGDDSYLKRCMEFYKKANVTAYGKSIKESEMYRDVGKYLGSVNPDVLIITGHDAILKKRVSDKNLYKNSENFIKCVKEARKIKGDNLIIIAGACQSNYEELIKAGATFASSPKRINIHALDPAIIATNICLTEKGKPIDLLSLLEKTKYGKDGIGGLKTKGVMNVGYPRNEV